VYINTLTDTPPATFIRPPSNVTLLASTVELPTPYSKIIIQWADNASNEDHFVLERSDDGVTYTDIAHPAANTTSYSDSAGLTPNTTYFYRLKAVNATGFSSYSEPVTTKTPPLPSAPTAAASPVPANGFQYVELTAGATTLKWTGSSNTTTYAIYFGTDANNLVKKAEIAYAANASYTMTGLTDFVTYYWRIDAINAKGITQGDLWQFRTSRIFPAGLVGHWSFDETEGRQVTDSSTYQHHGVLGLDDDNQNIRVAGKINNALDFSTANPDMYVVNVPHQDHLYLDKSSFSLSFWMKADAALLPTDNSTSAYLLCKGSITRNATTGATGKRIDIEFKSKQLRFAIDDDNDANGGGKDELQADGTPFFTGNWVHVTTIRDTAAKKLRLYMNGALVKETAIAKANAGIGEASDLIIGNIGALEFLSAANKPAPYKGMLDELKIFNYALSADEVLGLYHTSPLPIQTYSPSLAAGAALEGYGDSVRISWKGGMKSNKYKLYTGADSSNLTFVSDIALNNPTYTFNNLVAGTNYYWRVDAEGDAGTTKGATWWFRAVSPKGMTGHWKFDETSGTVVADNSNYHHNGAIVNMPEATFTTGKFGNGLQYMNPVAASAVNVPHAEQLLFDANSFTISLWIKLTNGSSNYNSGKDCYLVHKGQFTDPGGKWYGIQLKDSILTFAIDDASTKSNIDVSLKKASPHSIFNNNFSNIIAIKDTAAKQIRLYINGVLAGSKTYTTSGTIGKAVPLLIGNSLENKPFHDVMDDVRLFNYALSPMEIASLLIGNPLITAVTDPQPANGDTSIGYGTIDLGWKGKGQTYNIYAGTQPDSLGQIAAGLTTDSFALTNANRLGNYYWRVDAVRDGEVATGPTWWFRVIDTVPPTVITKKATVTLANGMATITANDINNGSADQYGIQRLQLDKYSFNCTNIGENEVLLTVIDSNNNSATARAIVTVTGSIPAPAITVSRTNNIYTGGDANTIYLGYGAQQLQLTATNAMPAQYSWSPAVALSDSTIANPVFAPTKAGEYSYTAKATNVYGCTATTSVNLHVKDVRCGGWDQKVTLCYHGFELCVSKLAVPILLYFGGELGNCKTGNARATTNGDQLPALINAEQKLMVYPVPASNQCTIAFSLNKPGKYQVAIYNAQGRLVQVVGKGEVTGNQLLTYPMNTSRLSTGVYFVKLVTATKVQVKQLIIQR
jgi:hypothetical protein